ncbi:Uncharacterised protein [Mycobacteroides abscessus subsp. abscessus]|nr:Uncharacterised protein [Mycobacteroides abscessus subsp. abscessus]
MPSAAGERRQTSPPMLTPFSSERVRPGLGGVVRSADIRYFVAVRIGPTHRAPRSVSWNSSEPPLRCAPNTASSWDSVIAAGQTSCPAGAPVASAAMSKATASSNARAITVTPNWASPAVPAGTDTAHRSNRLQKLV